MSSVLIRDIAEVRGGGTPRKSVQKYYGGGIPWVTPKDMKRWIIGESEVTLTLEGVENSPAKIVPPGSVLLVVRSGVLKHTLPVALTTTPVTLNQDMKALIPSSAVDGGYLARLTKARQAEVLGWVRATTADNFPIEKLLDLQIDLPQVDEQRRIAAILDQADALRAKRRQVLAHLDALTQAIFHDMFGHSRLPIRRFDDVVLDLEGGRSIVAEDSAANSNYRVLKISAVTSNRFRAEESKPLPVGYEPPIHHLVRRGDLLISRANTADLVGAVALVDQDVAGLALPDKLWRFVWREPDGVEPLYMWMLLQSSGMRHELSSRASGTGGSMKNISKAKLRSILLPWPSFDLQSEFAARVRMVNEESVMMRRRAECSDALFSSLQSRAFRGEL